MTRWTTGRTSVGTRARCDEKRLNFEHASEPRRSRAKRVLFVQTKTICTQHNLRTSDGPTDLSAPRRVVRALTFPGRSAARSVARRQDQASSRARAPSLRVAASLKRVCARSPHSQPRGGGRSHSPCMTSPPRRGASMVASTAPAAGSPPASVGAAATSRDHAVLSVPAGEGVTNDADAPRERTGIKISLDGVGAMITARRGAKGRAASTGTPRAPEEGAVDDKNVTILLQDVRRTRYRSSSLSFLFLSRALNSRRSYAY